MLYYSYIIVYWVIVDYRGLGLKPSESLNPKAMQCKKPIYGVSASIAATASATVSAAVLKMGSQLLSQDHPARVLFRAPALGEGVDSQRRTKVRRADGLRLGLWSPKQEEVNAST